MSVNRKPRKPYRARPVNGHSYCNAINRMRPMNDDQTTDLAIAYQIALSGLLNEPNAQDAYTVQSQLRIAQELCSQGYGDFVDKIDAGLAALDRSFDRAAGLAPTHSTEQAYRLYAML